MNTRSEYSMKKLFNPRRILKSKLSFVIFFSFTLLSNAQDFKVKIACIGNSITYGARLEKPARDSYPTQLSNMLSEIYGDTCIVNNYGVSGRNMLKNAPKPIWNEPQFAEALRWTPDICIILLGTNDSRPGLWADYGDEFKKDYLAMIDTFKTINPNTIFILGEPTPIWKGHHYGGDSWDTKHNDTILVKNTIPIIKKVAKKTKATLIDFHTPFANSIQLFPDLLHPNPEGAHSIAELIFEEIRGNDFINKVEQNKLKQR